MGNNKKLIITAAIIGVFTVILVLLYGKSQSDKIEVFTSDQVEVVKAKKNLEVGDSIKKDSFYVEKVPRQFLPPNPLLSGEANLYMGLPLSVNVQKDGMILTSDFVTTAKMRTLSAKIPDDERAFTISVNEISGVAGLLNPGDRVDLLATFPLNPDEKVRKKEEKEEKKKLSRDEVLKKLMEQPNLEDENGEGYLTVTLLQNVTVLAVGQRMETYVADPENGRVDTSYGSVTLSVTIEEAEILAISQMKGQLTLLLRQEDDYETASTPRKTLKGVLDDLDIVQKQRTQRAITKRPKRKADRIEILRGG